MLVAPFAGSQAVAQTHNLTGTVVDAQGNPVAGAAVVIDGTTKGTSTGSDGSFALNGVMANQSLLVTFIGYEPQTVAIGSQTNMKVVLKEDNQTLDEVVVIGYGVQKKRDVTGSITSVKSDVFESRSVENAQQALQGKAPGVQVLSSSAAPGSSPSIRIRGFSSNNSGASEPLYVVDGLKVSDISYLDPSSIESMEILKDGASAAIYGVEAGNGVVLITTKKGKKGDGRIFYDFTYGITSLARKADLMNAEQTWPTRRPPATTSRCPRGTARPIPTGSTCFTATTVRSSAIRPASKWPTTMVRFTLRCRIWTTTVCTTATRTG